MGIRIVTRLDVGIRFDAQAHVFVSYAPALKIYSQGPTEEEALRAIESAIRLYLSTAYGANKLKGFAVSSGIGPNSPTEHYIEILKDGGFEPKVIPLELTQV